MPIKGDFDSTAMRPGDLAGPAPATGKPPVLTLDVSLYEDYLENSDLTDEQKREFLQALWIIMVGFVDLGFGIHPVQQAWEADGIQPDENGAGPLPTLLAFQPKQEKEGEQSPGEEKL